MNGFAPLPASATWRHTAGREGFEVAFLREDAEGRVVRGSTSALEEGVPWYVAYEIGLDSGWRCRRAEISAHSPRGAATLSVVGDGEGNWLVDGEPTPGVGGCLDIDLESSALTNTFPIHRLALGIGERDEAPALYVRAVDLSIERVEQSYLAAPAWDGEYAAFDYESPSFGFTARVSVDASGLTLDYPGIAARVS